MNSNIKNPNARTLGSNQTNAKVYYKRKRYSRQFDRALLPTPASYYSKQFKKFKIKIEWVTVSCCFHAPDKHPSLSLSMIDGHFKCHACGAKGGDIVAFHMMRYGLSFVETINYFGAWKYE